MTTTKPPYRVMTMDEIRAQPMNGHTVASLFAGAGGSSTGYRMAGFRVLYANEFVPAAAETYAANMADGTILDGRDIREVSPDDILTQIGKAPGELDILDGSPPCASFSTAGARHKKWGVVSKYSDTEQRTDDLFMEYARILEGVQPRVFVAENVSGLVKGTARGYFKLILQRLEAAGYKVSARLLDASWLGVPQARQRLIFVGVRDDLPAVPVHPSPLPYRYTLRDALPYAQRHGTMPPHAVFVGNDRDIASTLVPSDRPAPTIMASGPASGTGWVETLQVIHDTSGQWSSGDVTDKPAPTVTVGANSVNSRHFQVAGDAITEDPETGEPITIGRYAIGAEAAKLREGETSNRYFNLARAHTDKPSPTVTAKGGQLDAAGVVHPGALRKFTLGELRAVCGFPPDYILTGSYTQRWERLGRSVPPVMMAAIASTVRDRILACVG